MVFYIKQVMVRIQGKFAQTLTAIITFAIAWFVAYKNPSVIGIIEAIGGPVLAILLFLMPLYCIYRFDILARFRNKIFRSFCFGNGDSCNFCCNS